MQFYCNALTAIFSSIYNSVKTPLKTPTELLLKHIYTYMYIKSNLIEEPLTKYKFIVKNEALIHIYQEINQGIEEFTSAYLKINQGDILETLKSCFTVDWSAYATLQPVLFEFDRD